MSQNHPVLPEPVLQAVDVRRSVEHEGGVLQILHGVNLLLNAGETAVIVGASGSGKSTLLSLLAGLEQPTSGQIALFGHVLGELDENQRAYLRQQYIGFVFQSFQLLPSLTALENVSLPLVLAGVDESEADARAEAMLARVGLSQRLGHLPKHLSGGEQQRVALARAFVGSPKLLFADEPTGNLDVNTGDQIVELMFELNQAQGTTLVLVTHDGHLAARCQRAFHLANGRLSELAR